MENCKNNVSTEALHKELDLIQSCITRMAQNSFMVKGWTVGIITVLIALAAEKIDAWMICLMSAAIVAVFWTLDAFFLKMEKCYRFKYNWVIIKRMEGNCDFLYDLNPYNTKTREDGIKTPAITSVMFSKPHTLLLFYGFLLVIGVAVLVLDLCGMIQ